MYIFPLLRLCVLSCEMRWCFRLGATYAAGYSQTLLLFSCQLLSLAWEEGALTKYRIPMIEWMSLRPKLFISEVDNHLFTSTIPHLNTTTPPSQQDQHHCYRLYKSAVQHLNTTTPSQQDQHHCYRLYKSTVQHLDTTTRPTPLLLPIYLHHSTPQHNDAISTRRASLLP